MTARETGSVALTPDDIRLYAKDKPDFNVLLEGEVQSSDDLIRLAMRLTVSDFNSASPVTAYVVETFPNDMVLLYGTLHHLANGEAERQLRNQVTYNAQGLNAGIDDKAMLYNQLAQFYKTLFEQKLRDYKMYLNAQDAWGGSFSPYACLNDYEFRS